MFQHGRKGVRIFSYLSSFCLTGLVLLAFLALQSGTFYLVDLPTAIIVILLPLLLQLTLYGRKALSAFAAPFASALPATELKAAVAFYSTYMKNTWLLALVSGLSNLVLHNQYLGNADILGSIIGVSALGLLYAGCVSLLVIVPLRALTLQCSIK